MSSSWDLNCFCKVFCKKILLVDFLGNKFKKISNKFFNSKTTKAILINLVKRNSTIAHFEQDLRGGSTW
jgi:hypothetical protein